MHHISSIQEYRPTARSNLWAILHFPAEKPFMALSQRFFHTIILLRPYIFRLWAVKLPRRGPPSAGPPRVDSILRE